MAKNDLYLLKEEQVGKALLIMVIPSIIAGSINQLNIVIDSFFLGNFSSPNTSIYALGATSVSMSLLFIINAVVIMLAIGNSVFATQNLGANNLKVVKQSIANTYIVGAITCLLFILTLGFLLPYIVSLLTKVPAYSFDNPLYMNSFAYCLIMLVGMPFIMFVQIPAMLLRNEGKAKIIVYTSIIQIIINIVLNYILISNRFSFSFYGTNYEAAGAGIATVFSQFFQALILTLLLIKSKTSAFNLKLKERSLSITWFKSVFRLGAPQLLVSLFLSIAMFSLGVSLAMSNITDIEFNAGLASSGVIIKVILMIYLFINGGIQGIQGFFSFQYGSKLKERLHLAISISQVSAIIIGIILSITFFIFGSNIANIFSNDPLVIKQIAFGLKIFSITLIVLPFGHLCFGLFASLGRPDLAIKATCVRDGLLFIGFSIAFPLIFGVIGSSIAFPLSLLFGSIFIILLFLNHKNSILN